MILIEGVNKDLALFLGMLTGDGCLPVKKNGDGNRVYPICFYNTNFRYVKLFSELFHKLFKLNGKISRRVRQNKKPLYEFQKYSKEVYEFIVHDLGIFPGKKAKNVSVPTYILKGDSSIKLHYLLGFWITDGGIRSNGTCIVHVASPRLCEGLKQLLDEIVGDSVKIRKYTQNGKYKSYQINLNKVQSTKIISNMPISHNLVLR